MMASTPCGETRIQRHATIYEERRPSHIIGRVGSKPDRGFGNVFRNADTAFRDQPEQLRLPLWAYPRQSG